MKTKYFATAAGAQGHADRVVSVWQNLEARVVEGIGPDFKTRFHVETRHPADGFSARWLPVGGFSRRALRVGPDGRILGPLYPRGRSLGGSAESQRDKAERERLQDAGCYAPRSR